MDHLEEEILYALCKDSKNPTLLHHYFLLLKRNEKYDEGREQLEIALEANPDHWQIHQDFGRLSMTLENHEAARDHILKSLELNPLDDDSHVNIAFVYKRLGDVELAKAHCHKTLEIDSGNSGAHFLLSTLYREDPVDIKTAKMHFEKIFDRFPGSGIFTHMYAMFLHSNDFTEEAGVQYKKAVEFRPELSKLRTHYARWLVFNGRFADARAQLQEASGKCNDADCFEFCSFYGDFLKETGEIFTAKVQLEKAVELKPDNYTCRHKLAEVCKTIGDMDRAAIHYEKLGETLIEQKQSNILFWKTAVFFANEFEDWEKAERYAAKALEFEPEDGEVHLFYAHLMTEMGDYDKAHVHLQEMIKLQPDNMGNHILAVMFLSEQEKYKAFCQGILDNWLEKEPSNTKLLMKAAYFSFMHGNEMQARDYLQKLLEVEPDNEFARKRLNDIERKLLIQNMQLAFDSS